MEFRTKIEKLDTEEIVNSPYINWNYFKNSTIMVTGATGLIGSQLVQSILYANETKGVNIRILALVRNLKKAENIFGSDTQNLKYIVQDITETITSDISPDFIIHTANGTSSKGFAEQPVETIDSIVTGTKNILEFGVNTGNIKGIVYLSSMEVYGKTDFNRTEPLRENEYGYIDLLNTRNSYPIGKQLAENLCYAYAKEYNLPLKIARLSQTIGAGVDFNDNRVFAQFARNIVLKEDIVLHTQGETTRSYIYITDMITAIFAMLERGIDGEAYNVTNTSTACSIKEMAQMLTDKYTSSKLRIEPKENNFYLDKVRLVLDTKKLEKINWEPSVKLDDMFNRLIQDFYLRPAKNIVKDDIKLPLIKKFVQQIFSIKNRSLNKEITFFGIKITTKRKNKYKKYDGIRINPKKIILYDNHGQGYCGNLKYIAEEIIKQNLNYELVWIDNANAELQKSFPKEIKFVQDDTNDALKEFAEAKIWISAQRLTRLVAKGLKKKEGQFYIQVWHGSLGIKKIGFDEHPTEEHEYSPLWKIGAEMLDYAISNSEFEENVYRSNFFAQGENLRLGHARSDIFFKDNTSIKNKVYSELGIDSTKKIILYAPTFRNKDTDINCSGIEYSLDYEKVVDTCNKKFGGEYILVTRFHPYVAKNLGFLLTQHHIVNGNNYPDIQELLAVSDIVISDYSSIMFDFMLTKRPVFIFATDIEEYNTERGFYYPLETTPFMIGKTNEKLIENIENFDNDTYQNKLVEFLDKKGAIDDGHSSERIVELIKGIID